MDADKKNNFANCGLFWVTNSVSSVVMGVVNRAQQEENMMQNLDFQLELEQARNRAQDEIQAEQIAFKRRQMKMALQYRQDEAVKLFDQQIKAIELQSFIDKYWPLAPQLPFTLLNEIERSVKSQEMLPLNVVLLREPLTYEVKRRTLAGKEVAKNTEIYKEIEYNIDSQLQQFGDMRLRRDSCSVGQINGNANMMNIHFLMGALPTLVISPQYNGDGKLVFSAAAWDAQASRPLIRHLFSVCHNPIEMWNNEKLQGEVIEKINTVITIIAGVTRDSYMLTTYGKAPLLDKILTTRQKELVACDRSMNKFIATEYENLVKALDVDTTPNLLEAYSQCDVDDMRQQAEKMCLTFKNMK